MGWETIVVGVIVGAAMVWAVRGAMRAARRKQVCSTCGSSGDCPLVKGVNAPDAPGATCGLDAAPPPVDKPHR
jgi:hypothetical protein